MFSIAIMFFILATVYQWLACENNQDTADKLMLWFCVYYKQGNRNISLDLKLKCFYDKDNLIQFKRHIK